MPNGRYGSRDLEERKKVMGRKLMGSRKEERLGRIMC